MEAERAEEQGVPGVAEAVRAEAVLTYSASEAMVPVALPMGAVSAPEPQRAEEGAEEHRVRVSVEITEAALAEETVAREPEAVPSGSFGARAVHSRLPILS